MFNIGRCLPLHCHQTWTRNEIHHSIPGGRDGRKGPSHDPQRMRFNSTASNRFSLLVCLSISIILCEISKIMENSVIFFLIGIAEVTERAPDSRVFCTRGPRTPTVPNCRHRSDSASATTTSRASNIWSFRSTTPPNCRRACGTTPVSIWKSPANRQ